MSYRNAEKLLLLVLWLQGSRHGLTLDELAEKLATSRRSIQRLMALLRQGEMGTAGLALVEDEVWQRPTRFRVATRPLRTLLSMTTEELAALDDAVAALRLHNLTREASELSRLAAKIRALADEAVLDNIEAEVAYRTEARSFATRPGPRNPLDAAIVAAIERAIVDLCQIRFDYRRVDEAEAGGRVMCPFGIIIGKFHYLIAFDAARGAGESGELLRTYRIDRMSKVEVLDRPFVRPERPTIAEFARNSFGIYQEPPRKVRWRFSPAKAEEAAGFVFHPTQTATRESNGALLVEFEAGGLKEMTWELFQWDGEVEILDPPELKQVMAEQIELAHRTFEGREASPGRQG